MNKPERPKWLDTYETAIIGFAPLDEDQLLAIIAVAAGHYRTHKGRFGAAEALRDLADSFETGQTPVAQP